jgi:LETM1 and EF-hand domain-containing protein 1
MCSSSGSSGDSKDVVSEEAKRSEMLRKTLASLKPLPRTQVVQGSGAKQTGSDVSATLGGGAAKEGQKSGKTSTSPEEPRFWTTRPEPKVAQASNPSLTWGEWIRDKEAIKASLKHEWEHYRDGSKLLYYNIVAAKQILQRRLRGQQLTRREYAMLVRTTSDLFRLVPFLIIVIVPFMEFAAPILLKLFPNMLPSTFASKLQQKENVKKQLNMKIEMARFLQDTLVEMKGDSTNSETRAFIEKLKSGEGVTTEDLIQYAKVFNEDVTLNNLQRNQLTAMCRLLGIQPFGTDALLIVQIRMKIASLKKDDKAIMAEGVNSLTLEELQHAVLARGMYSQTKNKRVLRERLKSWLDMSINKTVPITLLILSRAFALNNRADLAGTLKDTFNHMPQELIDEIEARVGAPMGRKVDRKMRLEALDQFHALIAEERASLVAGTSVDQSKTPFAALATMTQPTELERLQIEELRAQVTHIKNDIIDDAKALQESLDKLTAKLTKEQETEFADLLAKRGDMSPEEAKAAGFETDEQFKTRWTKKRSDILAVELGRQKEREAETRSARQLEQRVVGLLEQLGVDVAEAKQQLEEELKVLDKNYDGLISEDELKFALNALNEKLTDEQIQVVLDRLDANHDGLIEVDHLFKVARELDIDLSTAVAEARTKEALIQAKAEEASSPPSSPSSSSGSDGPIAL